VLPGGHFDLVRDDNAAALANVVRTEIQSQWEIAAMTLGFEYRKIWAGNAASNLADGITFVAIPLLATTLTHNPIAIAALDVAYTLPRILAVLGIGVMVDRGDRKKLLHVSNSTQTIIFAILCALQLTHAVSMPILYLVFASIGLTETLADSSAFAVLPQAVAAEGLDMANSQIAATQIILDEFVGPPIGGLLFAVAAFLPMGVNVVAFAIAGIAYFSLRGNYTVPVDPTRPRRTIYADIAEGIAWLRGNEIIRTLTIIGTLASIGYMIPFSYLVLYANQVLGLNAAGYGLLLSASALGGLVGSWVAGRIRSRIGYGWAIVAALLTGALAFAAVAATTSVVVVAVALAVYMCHAVVWNVLASSIRQKLVPAELMGRVGSVSRLLGLTGLAVGAFAGGWLAHALGLRMPFAVASVLFVVTAGLCAMTMRHFRMWEADQPAQGSAARADAVAAR
jgi:MFS family permease